MDREQRVSAIVGKERISVNQNSLMEICTFTTTFKAVMFLLVNVRFRINFKLAVFLAKNFYFVT